MTAVVLCRRTLLAGLGLAAAGLAVGIAPAEAMPAPPRSAGAVPPVARTDGGLHPNVFVHLAPDGATTIVCHRSEMGTGIRSSLPVLIADELGADMARVTIVQADGDAAYGDQNTDGSRSVRTLYDGMRQVAATARMMLVAVAAKRWRVSPETCSAKDHLVVHAASKRTIPFADLVADAAKLPVPTEAAVKLRPRSELTRTGKALPQLDAPDVVTGKAQFGADVFLPGMLTAVVARPPSVGGKLKRLAGEKALAVPGVVKLVEMPVPQGAPAFQPLGGVAVLATTTWAAIRGRAALDVEWEAGPNGAYDSEAYRKKLSASVAKPGRVVRNTGDVDAAFARGASFLEAEYHAPHLAQAPMEPPVAVAKVEGDHCEIWAATQNPQAAQKAVAGALGIPLDHVTVHVTKLGGGFGRKSKPDFVVEAALCAKAARVPVRVQWTREDDLRHGYFHTVSAQHLRASFDATGKITGWRHRTAFPPIPSTFDTTKTGPSDGELGQGVADLALDIPNVRAEACDAPAHVRIGWLRSVCNVFHGFAAGSFFDEIAAARQVDPKDNLLTMVGPARVASLAELGVEKVPNYGLSLDQHPIDVGRLRQVVERVAALSGWSERGRSSERGFGIAAHRSFNCCVGVVAAVKKDVRGRIQLDEAWVVADAGIVINPDRARAQMEGAVIFGASLALRSRITARAGAIEQSNFRDYVVLRMPEAPSRIHVELVPSDAPPGGIGEPGVPPVAPAIANAIFALTGVRHRELPMAV